MKKILPIFALMFIFLMIFTSVSIVSYAAQSPEATVYTSDDIDDNTSNSGGNLLTTESTSSGTSSGSVAGSSSYNYTGATYTYTRTASSAATRTRSSNYTVTRTAVTRTTKATKNYSTNSGKDDPSSPNYTGSKTTVKDNSSKGPDMSADNNLGIIFVIASVLISAACVTVVKTRKKEEN